MKKKPSIIAIDGPAASGKSTLGRRLADSLGYLFLDTGVMYRAITWMAVQREIDVRDEQAVSAMAENASIDVLPASKADGRLCDVIVQGQDITWEIRSPTVEASVSLISTYRGVRQAMSEKQRRIGLRGRVVMVGRDIGTVVLPEADLKIYLDASAAERGRRRHKENMAHGSGLNFGNTLDEVVERDRIDSSRDLAPLRVAADAVMIDSDKLTANEVFEQVRRLYE